MTETATATVRPIIEFAELRRKFVVRQKAGRVRRTKRLVHAVDGSASASVRGGVRLHRGQRGRQVDHDQDDHRDPGADLGHVRTCGLDPVPQRRELAREIGVVFGQRCQLWWDLPLRESFRILAAIHRLDPEAAASAGSSWSTGSRWATARHPRPPAVAGRADARRGRGGPAAPPRLLILDEPTIGLDMISKERLREFLIAERAEHGTTLLLTTHDMGDIERLCERVLVVDHGRLVYDGTWPGWRSGSALQRVLVVDLWEPRPPLQLVGATHVGIEGDGVRQRLAFSPHDTTAARCWPRCPRRARCAT